MAGFKAQQFWSGREDVSIRKVDGDELSGLPLSGTGNAYPRLSRVTLRADRTDRHLVPFAWLAAHRRDTLQAYLPKPLALNKALHILAFDKGYVTALLMASARSSVG